MTHRSARRRPPWALVVAATLASMPAAAAGSGAGAGGAGHQRAINMGLVPGEPGPPGAPNNPRSAPKPRTGPKEAPAAGGVPAER